ncbi:MAG: zinc ribbon domain-containing protein [candidate division Zixibacteria bacterium]|nr:zinc ribbon domain-containing protein [candidate division Zixibacteria bacterium]
MPIYEFTCQRCGAKFEILQRTNQDEKPSCPECGTEEVRKVFSVFGFSSGGKFVSSSSEGASCSTCSVRNCSSCR